MSGSSRSTLTAYGLAVASIALATGVRLWLDPALGDKLPFITYFAAIMVTAWFGGLGPTLAAAILGSLTAAYFVLPPAGMAVQGQEYQLGLGMFVLTGIAIAVLSESLHRAQRDADNTRIKWEHESRRLAVTLASIGDAVIVTDDQGRVTFLNRVAENLTGWMSAHAMGQELPRVFHIVNEQTRQAVENPVDKVLRHGAVVGLANHTILIARDGSERAIDDSAAPVRDAEGWLFGVVLVFRDIEQRRKTEADQAHLAALVASSEDAIVSKTLEGTITSWNAAAERLYGYSREEAVGQPVNLVVPPDRREELAEEMAKLHRGERFEAYETERVRKDGTRIELSVVASPVKNAAGDIIGISAIARDISQRKRNEAALLASQQRLRFLADASMTLSTLVDYQSTMQRMARLAIPFVADWCTVYLIDDEKNISRVATAHRDPETEVLLEDFERRFPLDWNSNLPLVEVLRTGSSRLVETVTPDVLASLLVDDEQRQMVDQMHVRSFMIVPLPSRSHTIGAVAFVRTESETRYDCADLEMAEDLARRAAVAIENARLYREIREADRRKDEFLAMLAHELRNPLAPLRNSLALLATPNVDDATSQWVQGVMERQVDQLVRLVDDLLDVSRIIRGKVELRPEPVELSTVVSRAVETARPLIDSQEHELTISLTPEPVWLNADLVRLAQVVSNLLNNAAKYTEKRGHIWLTAERLTDEVLLRVRDNGIGVAAENLPRIFDLFTQADRSLDRSQGGLGIGLSVVRNLVEMHGGSVTVKSEGLGKGSEFTVRIPVLAQAGPSKAPAWKPTVTKPRRVLVVDDNVGAATVLAKMLTKFWGHQVTAVHSGQTALDAALAERPELILLDIGLPGMNGYEVAERLRAQAEFQGTVLVALTGYGQDEDRRRSQQVGFDVHLVKPASVIALQELFSHAKLK